MATIVNNPPPSDNSNQSGPFVVLIVLMMFLVFGYLLFAYGIPALRRVGTPQVNVPSKIDVNVHQTK